VRVPAALDRPARIRGNAWRIERDAAREAVLLAEDEVVGDAVVEHEAALVAVFRYV
jgi:hypothetical protein